MINTYNLYTDIEPDAVGRMLEKWNCHSLTEGGFPREYFHGFTTLFVSRTEEISLTEYLLNFGESEEFVSGAKTLIFTGGGLARTADGGEFSSNLRPALDEISRGDIIKIRANFRAQSIKAHLVRLKNEDGKVSLPVYEAIK